jgi:trans-aconitate 2-methyltransferase
MTASDPSVPWRAEDYDAVAEPQQRWGRAVLDRVASLGSGWRGDELVLDAGCGSGRLLAEIAQRVPQGRIFAVDADTGMIAQARARAAQLGIEDRVQFWQGDLAALRLAGVRPAPLASSVGLELPEPVDVIFSNAVLHWIHDKIRLYAALRSVLKTDGRFVAQFGGSNNLQRARAAAYRAARDLGLSDPLLRNLGRHVFLAPQETKEQLKTCGFRQVRVWEADAPTDFADRESLQRFCGASIFTTMRAELEPQCWEQFIAEFAAQLYGLAGAWRLDYVRQNVDALG